MADRIDDQLSFRIDSALKQRFKVWCVKHRLDMSTVLIKAIEDAMRNPPPDLQMRRGRKPKR